MKIKLLLLLITAAPALLHAQGGSLTPPPGAPAPTMRSLQEIWEKLIIVEAQNASMSTQLTTQQSQIAALNAQNEALSNLVVSLGANSGALPWSFESIEGGTAMSVAVAPNGNIGISYIRNSSVLKFALYNGTAWSISTVPGTAGVVDTSLRFDALNQPGIAFMTNTSGLKYAGYNGLAWTVYNVDNSATLGNECSLAIGPNSMPGIAYEEEATRLVKYVVATESGWSINTVTNMGGDGMHDVSVAFHPSGQPVIAFGQSNGHVRYSTSTDYGKNWSTTIAAYTLSPLFISLAISPTGKVGIAITDWGSSQSLKYTELLGTGWAEEVVDSSSGSGLFCSLAFTAGGRPVIACHSNNGGGDVKYASHNGISWTVNVIDKRGTPGQNASLCLDLNGQPVIAYSAFSGAAIRIARRTPFAIP
jgi:hypothetical protein